MRRDHGSWVPQLVPRVHVALGAALLAAGRPTDAQKEFSEAAKGDSLNNPNGITWDAARSRFVLAPFAGPSVQTWTPGQNPATLVSGPGQYDGVEVLTGSGNILVSSWADSAVHVIRGSTMSALVKNVSAPADIGVDTKRNVLAVPRFNDGKVEYFRIP